MDRNENTVAIMNRLSRSAGHIGGIKKMIEDGRDCSDVLVQLYAVRAEITAVSKLILKNHIDRCVTGAVKDKDEELLAKLKEAIDILL